MRSNGFELRSRRCRLFLTAPAFFAGSGPARTLACCSRSPLQDQLSLFAPPAGSAVEDRSSSLIVHPAARPASRARRGLTGLDLILVPKVPGSKILGAKRIGLQRLVSPYPGLIRALNECRSHCVQVPRQVLQTCINCYCDHDLSLSDLLSHLKGANNVQAC